MSAGLQVREAQTRQFEDYYFSPVRDSNYRECTHCVMDTTAAEIQFDERGRCNFCTAAEARLRDIERRRASGELDWQRLAAEIASQGKRKPYDCVIGVSGGVDSSYVALLVREAGLRPLAVHLDNGWNSELAVQNIQSLCNKLHIDLYTHVIDWEEFRDMQRSFFAAHVVDIEMLSDHAISAVIQQQSQKRRLPYALLGTNSATEGIMPKNWRHPKLDAKNIRAIHRRFGNISPRTFPWTSFTRRHWARRLGRFRPVSMLDYVDYNKERAISELQETVGWRPYAQKHGESAFTYFYQCYILPRKFGIDKRRAHLSGLIASGQMSRQQALQHLAEPLFSAAELKGKCEFALKKLGFSQAALEKYLNEAPRGHGEYQSGWDRFVRRSPGLRRVKDLFRLLLR